MPDRGFKNRFDTTQRFARPCFAVIAHGLPLITSGSAIQFVVTSLVLLLAAVVDALSRRKSAPT